MFIALFFRSVNVVPSVVRGIAPRIRRTYKEVNIDQCNIDQLICDAMCDANIHAYKHSMDP